VPEEAIDSAMNRNGSVWHRGCIVHEIMALCLAEQRPLSRVCKFPKLWPRSDELGLDESPLSEGQARPVVRATLKIYGGRFDPLASIYRPSCESRVR
jgi:hypothetical protein